MYRNHLEKLVRTRLDDVLVDEGVLDRARLEAAQTEQDQKGCLLSDVLVDSQTIEEWDLAKLLCTHYALPFVDVLHYSIPGPVLDLLPLDWCRQNSILPIDQFGKSIALACAEIPSSELVQEILGRTGCTPFIYVAVRRPLREVIDENLKRRAGRPGSSIFASPNSSKAGASLSPASTAAGVLAQSINVKLDADDDLPPLDLPRISLQLDASAAGLLVAANGQAAPKRAQVERFARPAPTTVASHTAGSSTGAAPSSASSSQQPAPVQKVTPMQQLLGRPPAAAASAAPPVPRVDEPARPKLGSRPAPVLPPPPPKGGAAQPGQSGWESIFDIGEDAVRRSRSDDVRSSRP